MASLNGKSLGRYQIIEQLGEGGMAAVYKAYDARLERFVAIKVIRTDQFAPSMLDEILKRFEREAKALAKLSHPNIVHVHDYGEYEGAPYLVMEYLPSGTLKQKPDTPMPWKEAVQIVLPIAHALAYAHEHNIIHRDIKPGNILLTDKGQPMLSDFGIAKILQDNEGATLTGAGMSIGTPEYMAPEQWTGESGPQSDIYSLGVVLYELVTGRKPYIADTPVGVMLKQVTDPLPRPSEFMPDLPEKLENVLLKALEKQPEDRYKNMSEFASALESVASGQSLPTEKKLEEFQTGKTLLASGSALQEVESATAVGGNGNKAGSALKPEIPASAEGQLQAKQIRRRRWIPLAGTAVLLCIGLTAVLYLVINGLRSGKPLAGLDKPTSTAVPTQLISQTLSSQTPHAEVKVLWDISHGPRTSQDGTLYTPDGMYKSLANVLSTDKFVITSGDLSNLNSYDILVLSETSGKNPYTSNEVDQIEQFVRTSGHGLLILSDTPDLENLADIVGRRFSIGLGELTSNGPASYSNEPFFSGVTSLQFINGAGVFQVSSPSQTAAQDKDGNSVIAFCECDAGRVLAISDTNLWDNSGFSQADNKVFAINVFEWLAKVSP